MWQRELLLLLCEMAGSKWAYGGAGRGGECIAMTHHCVTVELCGDKRN